MTVSSSTNRVSYSGNGTLTAFAYTFKIFDEGDLTVILRASDGTETVQTITTHYTVSGVGDVGGGNVTFVTAPTATQTVVILREQPLTQGLDLVPNDPFPANSLEEALDKIVFMTQKHEEELGRAIKASRTNTITGAEFTISASDRANKIFAFDSSGDVSITQEIGTFRGNWATSTAYEVRDLVKDTSTNNIFIVNSAHTSSGAQPLTTNANSAKYDLIVDAAAASTSATNAAASETAAETAQTAAETAQTAAETAQTAAETAETNAETAQTAAETAQTAAETAQSAAETAYDNFDDRYLGAKASDPTLDNDGDALIDGALYFDTTNNVLKVYDLGGTAWRRTTPTTSEQTNINTVSGISANVTTVAGISSNVTTVAGISSDVTTVAADGTDIGTVAGISANVTTVAGVSSDVTTVAGISSDVTTVSGISANVTTVAGVSANVTTVAGVSADVTTVAGISANVTTVATNDANITTVATNITGVNSFAERYRVGSSDPTTSLDEGDLAYNSTANVLKYYNGTSWQSISPGIGSVADDSTPQLGGNLDLNSNNITGTGDITTIGTLGIGTTSDTLYYNSTSTYNVTASIKTNTANEVSELALINGNNNFGSAIDFARTNSAGNDVRFATINALPTNNTAGTEAGALRFYTKNTTDSNVAERMRIGQDGNVGIGTTSPAHEFHVSTSGTSTASGGNVAVSIRSEASGRSSTLQFSDGTIASWIGQVSGSNINFGTNGSERMRIDSSGNVGIGTSSPKLNANNGTFLSVIGTNLNGWLELGTTSQTDGYGGALSFNNTNIVAADKRVAQISSVRSGADNSAYLSFHTANAGSIAERFRFGTSGELGIGGATYGTSGQVLTSGGSGAAPSWADASSGGMTQITSGTIGTNSSYSFSLGSSWWNTYQYVMFFYDATYQSGDPPSGTTNAFFRLGTLTSSSYTSAGQGGSTNNSTVGNAGYLNRTSPGDNNNIFFVGRIYTDGTNTHVFTGSSSASSQNGNGFQSVYAPTVPETFIVYQPYFGSERYRYEGTITFYGVK
jgi:hypothetical protein